MKGKKLIVVYHRIGDTTCDYNRIVVNRDVFISQLDYFQEKYLVLSLDELQNYDGESDCIAITFDDGYEDFWTTAFPIMETRNIPVTVFVCSGRIDQSDEMWMNEIIRMCFFHSKYVEKIHLDFCGNNVALPLKSADDRVKTYNTLRRMFCQIGNEKKKQYIESIQKQLGLSNVGRSEYRMLSSTQIVELASNKLITIGAHTVSHPLLGELDEIDFRTEIQASIHSIERISNKKVELFSYPFGNINSYNDKIIQVLQSCGIKRAYTVENRALYEDEYDYTIPRIYMYNVEGEALESYMDLGDKNTDEDKDRYFGMGENDKLVNIDKVLIFGIGQNATAVANRVLQKNIKIIAFVVSEKKEQERTFMGHEIWNISEMIKYAKEEPIIIKNNQDFRIVEKLSKMGKNKVHWWI